MASYIARRLLIGLLTLFLITFLVYGLVRLMPGDPTKVALGEDASKKLSKADFAQLREYYGLDKPWYVAYLGWLGNVVQFDLGPSFIQKTTVAKAIGARIGPSLLLAGSSLILAYLLSIPLGLYSSARSGKPDERILGTVLYMLYSLPAFVAALFLQVLFAIWLRDTWLELPLFGLTSDNYTELSTLGRALDIMKHAILPIFCYTYGTLAYETRFIRANMQEVLRQDYIRTARAKGVGPIRVLVHHAFRNTLIPFVTLIGLTLPVLLSGAVVLEQVFSWPGIGRLMFESITSLDYATTMGLTLVFSILTLASQLLADILYAVVDPRVRYS
jgi:peptide/nickel transport system permease protein